jgi:Ca-activated chloride channel family protein
MKTSTLSVYQIKPIFNFLIVALLISTFVLTGCETSSISTNSAAVQRESTVTTSTNTAVATSDIASTNMGTIMPIAQPPYTSEDAKASTERYAQIDENPFLDATRAPLSTFSIDVDTASYSNVRRYLNDGQLPPRDAVRIEELINYFEYDYPQPLGQEPFSVTTEATICPWNANHGLVLVGLQGRKVSLDNVPPSNLVFLVDVSGSMADPLKLPLLKQSFKTLVNQLSAKDRVAVVVYAGSSGLALPSTTADRKSEIFAALDNLEAGGSTNGGQGIQLAYRIAAENFIKNGNNRVILATDGDFNVGLTGDDELVRMIEQKRQLGVFLSVLGFGTGNTNDSMMEKLADKGNGNYAYIDSLDEARKALGEQVSGTLYTIAKDVKFKSNLIHRELQVID